MDDLDEEFTSIIFEDALLCNADPQYPVEFKFINRNQYQMTNKEIAYLETNLHELKEFEGKSIQLNSTNKQKKVGSLKIKSIKIDPMPAFTDYLKQGWEIALIGAIDFTYSNGNSSNPTSLHFVSDHLNHYEQVINSVGKILCEYDSDH